MSNTRRAKAAPQKVYKFESLQKQADKRRAENPVPQRDIPPFRLDLGGGNVIEITEPDTLERQLTIAQFVGQWRRGDWDMGSAIPLLQAFCGEQFGIIWNLIKGDRDPALMVELINAMFDHFSGVLEHVTEAEDDLPGGSGDSSN